MPAGYDETVPVPATVTLSVNIGAAVNVAVTLRAALIVTGQLPVPGQVMPLPDHPVNVAPFIADAVSVTAVLDA